jgi:hypothetical protein
VLTYARSAFNTIRVTKDAQGLRAMWFRANRGRQSVIRRWRAPPSGVALPIAPISRHANLWLTTSTSYRPDDDSSQGRPMASTISRPSF